MPRAALLRGEGGSGAEEGLTGVGMGAVVAAGGVLLSPGGYLGRRAKVASTVP